MKPRGSLKLQCISASGAALHRSTGVRNMTRWPRETLTRLNSILANLYPTVGDSRRIVADAGLRAALIEFDNKAIVNWFNILQHAKVQGKVCEILKLAVEDYPNDESLLKARDGIPPPDLKGPETKHWNGPSAAPTLEKLMGQTSTLISV